MMTATDDGAAPAGGVQSGRIAGFRTYHRVLALMLVFGLFFPWVGDVFNSINENITQCWYKQLTGKPCIFCGGTHAYRDWLAGRAPLMFKHAMVVVWWVVEFMRHVCALVALRFWPSWFEGRRIWLWEGVLFVLVFLMGILPLALDIR